MEDTETTTPAPTPEPESTPGPTPTLTPADAHVSRDNAAGARQDDGHSGGAKKVGQASSGVRKKF